MKTGEAILALCVLAMGGVIAIKAATRTPRPSAHVAAKSDDDSIFKVPLKRTAAESMRVADARATEVKAAIGERGGVTFINDILRENDSTVRHWTARGGTPVRLWLQVPQGVSDYRATFPGFVTQALDSWSAVDGMPVRFEIVNDSASAHVVVVWTPLLQGNRIGLTRIEAVNDTIRTGRITIATQREGGIALKDEDIARCALHEVGHLLGLAHTSDLASIMAPESAQPGLSDRDRATVKLLYALPIGSIKAGAQY